MKYISKLLLIISLLLSNAYAIKYLDSGLLDMKEMFNDINTEKDLNESELALSLQYEFMIKQIKINDKLKFTNEYYSTLILLGQLHSKKENYEKSNFYYNKSKELLLNPDVLYAIGMNKLYLTDFSGFESYHYRYKKSQPSFIVPQLNIERIEKLSEINKSDNLIILNEQGMGDEILFSRAFKFISENANNVTIKVRPTFLKFFKTKYQDLKNITFITGSLTQNEVFQNFNKYALLGDIFSSLTESEMFSLKTEKFKFPDKNLKIGISYSYGKSGNNKNGIIKNLGERRAVDKSFFKKVLIDNNLSVVDFSYDDNIKEIKSYNFPKDYSETYQNLLKEKINFVVTIDSSFGHFTGNLGIPTVILINDYKDWRWRFNNTDGTNKFFNSIKVMTLTDFEKFIKNKCLIM